MQLGRPAALVAQLGVAPPLQQQLECGGTPAPARRVQRRVAVLVGGVECCTGVEQQRHRLYVALVCSSVVRVRVRVRVRVEG